jgi:hypothetical protein
MGRNNVNTAIRRLLSIVVLLSAAILPLRADSDDPPSRVARLSFLKGDVSFEPSGESQWSQASLNYPLTTGDRIYTNNGGEAEFETGNVALRLNGNTDVSVTNLNDQVLQLGLAQGIMRVRAYNMLSGNSIEIDAPNAAFEVLGNGNYRFETYPSDDATLVTVNSGELRITGNGIEQTLHSGQSAKLVGDPVQIAWLSPPRSDDFDNWCNGRDRIFVSSPSLQYVGPYVPGFYDLDSYGSWTTVSPYGPVWYPGSIPAGWVPYREGRWAWVSPWGWTWVDEEPWGFAPFHYGRWELINSRWGWIPGPPVVDVRPVYAPALVAFVGGTGLSIGFTAGPPVAWFPLGPREPFYPWYHHSDDYVRQVNIRNVTNITNITNATYVNNIHYINREVATTAVPANVFRGGEPVERQAVRIDRDQIARAAVIPHPEVAPDRRAVIAGAAVTHPPVEQQRPRIDYRQPQPNRGPEQAEGRNVPNQERPVIDNAQRAAPPVQASGRPEPQRPVFENRPQQPQENAQGGMPPARNQRPLVTRTAPPPPNPSFEQRQPAMEQHPGRPLEPQQVQNLREGRPAGPMHDQEFPPHQQAQQQRAPEREGRPR